MFEHKVEVTLIEYIRDVLDPQFQPPNEPHLLDWNIFGKEIKYLFGYYPYPSDNIFLSEALWYKYRPEVVNLLKWIDNNLFQKLLVNNAQTNQVLLCIFANKLKKINLPEYLDGTLHVATVSCYYARKKVYLDWYFKEYLNIPF